MNIEQIEKNIETLTKNLKKEEFIFDLLSAYGIPKATITLLKKGRHNLSKEPGGIILKRRLFFQEIKNEDLHGTIDSLQKNTATKRHNPRFIVVTDFETILAADTRTNEHLDIPINDLKRHYDFFLPWAGIEKHRHKNENIADRKAAEKMAKLYDAILADNHIVNKEKVHDLNVFLARLLFCFFAEDTKIFKEDGLFTNSIDSHTQSDGSDLHIYLEKLFDVLNLVEKDRQHYPAYLQKFPYVNGGLFSKKHWIPEFTARARKIIVECGKLDWSKINPDIFGSMMQAVVHPSKRGSLGMHYTSVPNIMKVIGPLFLDELTEEFESNRSNKKKLNELRIRMSKLKIFDPACGSGNFLIISYKELRRLEMEIIKEMGTFSFSDIRIAQFYGIEIDDFAHQIAKLSLYLAEHQMNTEFQSTFGKANPTLPLNPGGNIVCDNATKIEWNKVCPKNAEDEIYILGNPPYLGFNERNKEQKHDVDIALQDIEGARRLDYIGCWFVKASNYIYNSLAKFAFVSTNSICQGEQVSLLWPYIISQKQEIFFAYTPFKWVNNARGKAAVICIIVGIQNYNPKCNKKIYTGDRLKIVNKISPYLIEGEPIIMQQRSRPLSSLPIMMLGSSGIDGGHLVLSFKEKEKLIKEVPRALKFIRPYIGGKDFLSGNERYCLWVEDSMRAEAETISEVKERFEACREYRLTAGRDAKKAARVPHRFFYRKFQDGSAIVLPMTSSERREYIPVGFFESGIIFSNGVFVIYGGEPNIIGILSSRMHMVWMKITSGKLKSDFRYSVNLTYNTFPIPQFTTNQKAEITRHVYTVLEEREKHTEKTMAQMYDPDKMPDGLKEAHHHLDLAIERCYRSRPFTNDEERLEYLFRLYEQMITEERLLSQNNT